MNKNKLENQIEVMQHFLNGGEIEYAFLSDEDTWFRNFKPAWDWNNFNYRIKQPDIKYPVYAQLKNFESTLIVKFISETEGEVIESYAIEFEKGHISKYWTPVYKDAVWEILPEYKEKPKLKTYYEVINCIGSCYNISGTLYTEEELSNMGEEYLKTGRSFELPDKG